MMGFFSWQCAKTRKPVMADVAVRPGPWQFSSRVVVVFKNGDRITGDYDGYGRVGPLDLQDYDQNAWRMVIKDYYNGETFEQLERNCSDPGQGYFYNDADLVRIFG